MCDASRIGCDLVAADRAAVVADVEAVEFAGPPVWRVLDGLTVHTPSVERMFARARRCRFA